MPTSDISTPTQGIELTDSAARRIAWHVLDHAWEIEDRGGIEPRHAW